MPRRGRRRSVASGMRWVERPRLVVGLIAVAIVVMGLTYFTYDAIKARSALVSAESQAKSLRNQIAAGDLNGSQASLEALQASTASARAHSNGPLWKLAGAMPLVGRDFNAVSTVSRVLDTIASNGISPVVQSQLNVDTFKPVNGRIDLGAMAELAPAVAKTDRILSAGLRELDDIEPQSLAGPLREPYERLHAKLADTQKAASAGAKALNLMPSMLGGQGRRTYLLAVQNNAEIRSTGGIPGAYAFLRAKDGQLTIGKQGAATDFGYFDRSGGQADSRRASPVHELHGPLVGRHDIYSRLPTHCADHAGHGEGEVRSLR